MDSVTVNKEDLLATLKANRESHIGKFEEVLTAYRNEAVRLLEEHIERIRSGAVEKVAVMLPEPKNYESEYDRAIAMVEWEQKPTIELDENTFGQWVLDEWSWKTSFTQTSLMYTDPMKA